MNEVDLKLTIIRDTDLCIQDGRWSWMKLIKGDNYRLTKVVFYLVNQRYDRHLILLWNNNWHLLEAFELFPKRGLMLMVELMLELWIFDFILFSLYFLFLLLLGLGFSMISWSQSHKLLHKCCHSHSHMIICHDRKT